MLRPPQILHVPHSSIGDESMTFKWLLVFASLCALPAWSFGQSGTPDGDPPDSGYVSPFLANLDRANVGEDEATRARIETFREARGVSPSRRVNVFEQAQIQRQLFPQLMPGATPSSGTPVWTNLGFFKTNSEWCDSQCDR